MTQTSTRPRTAAPVLTLWSVNITPRGFGNTEDGWVMAETANDARAAAVMAGMVMHPGQWVAASVNPQQRVEDGECIARFLTLSDVPTGGRVWNFGPGAARRQRAAVAAGKLKRAGDVIDFWKLTD